MSILGNIIWFLFGGIFAGLGWYLVGLLTFGIGFLWVLPYREMTLVKYFNQLEVTYVA